MIPKYKAKVLIDLVNSKMKAGDWMESDSLSSDPYERVVGQFGIRRNFNV